MKPARILWLALAASAIAALTLVPIPEQAPRSAETPLWCVLCGDGGLADFLLNIALFVPLGTALRTVGASVGTVALLGLGTTLGVETLQATVVTGRDPSLGDVLANTAGSLLGAILASRWRSVVRPRPALARRAALAWGAGAALSVAATAGLARIALPEGPWYGQWTTTGPEPEWFDGTVIRATFDGLEVPHGRFEGEPYRVRSAERDLEFGAEIISGSPVPDPLRIASVASDDRRFVTLGQRGRDLVFSARTRASRLRLRSPAWRLPEALPPARGATASIVGRYGRGRVTLGSLHGDRDEQGRWSIGPFDAWRFLLGDAVPGGWPVPLARALWIGALSAPVGWWSARAPGRASKIVPLITIAGAALLWIAAGMPAAPAWEWAVLGGAWLMAYLTSVRAARVK